MVEPRAEAREPEPYFVRRRGRTPREPRRRKSHLMGLELCSSVKVRAGEGSEVKATSLLLDLPGGKAVFRRS